jgi:TolB-like protein/predicted Zn-dependent protease
LSFFDELTRRNVLRVGAAYIVTSWLLIQVAETIFPLFGYGDTPARMAVILLAIGFIPALVLSWVFEWTPDGFKRDSDVVPGQPASLQGAKRLDRIIMVVLALALGYFGFDKFVLDPLRDEAIAEAAGEAAVEQALEEALLGRMSDKSVAVLPFDNRSNLDDDEFFTDGMHDELLTRLSRISELKVISRTSVMRYRDTLMSIPEIARELSVAAILEGGVQRAGNQVRINVQLIDAKTDEHLWAEIYDRELTTDNLFAIQSEITEAIAESMHATLSPAERGRVLDKPTDSLEAYSHYLRGRQLLTTRNREEVEKAYKEFVLATEIDPNFALAWVGAADSLTLLHGYGAVGREEYVDRHKPLVDKALAVNDQLGEAYVALSALYGTPSEFYDREKQMAALHKAIKLNPNYAQAYHWYASSLEARTQEQREERLRLYYKAAELDPRSSVIQLNIAGELAGMGRIDEGRRVLEQLLRWDPGFALAHTRIGNLHNASGQFARGVQAYKEALKLDPGNGSIMIGQALNYMRLGEYEAMYEIRERLNEIAAEDFMSILWLDHDIWITRSQTQEGLDELKSRFGSEVEEETFLQSLVYKLHLYSGDLEQAAQWMEKFLPPRPYKIESEQEANVCGYAGVLIRAGDAEDAIFGKRVVEQVIDDINVRRERGEIYVDSVLDRIRCMVLAGDIDPAIDLLESRVAKGNYHEHHKWGKEPWFRELEGIPRYDAIVETIESRLAEQRALLAEMAVRVH